MCCHLPRVLSKPGDRSGRGRRQPQRRGHRRVDRRLVQELVTGEPGGGHDHDGRGEPRAGPETALRPAAAPPSRRGVLARDVRRSQRALKVGVIIGVRVLGWPARERLRRFASRREAPDRRPPAGACRPGSAGPAWASPARQGPAGGRCPDPGPAGGRCREAGPAGPAARADEPLRAGPGTQDPLGAAPSRGRIRWRRIPGDHAGSGPVFSSAASNPGTVGAFQRRPGRLTARVRGRAASCALVIHKVESSVLFSSGRVVAELSRSRLIGGEP